jgi:hypothetical protein
MQALNYLCVDMMEMAHHQLQMIQNPLQLLILEGRVLNHHFQLVILTFDIV